MSFVFPCNLKLHEDDQIIFWYIWGNDLNIENVIYNFKEMFRLLRVNEHKPIVFYVDSKYKDGCQYVGGYLNPVKTRHSKIIINQNFIRFSDAINMFKFQEQEKLQSVHYDGTGARIGIEVLAGYHFLLGIQLDTMIQKINACRNVNAYIYQI